MSKKKVISTKFAYYDDALDERLKDPEYAIDYLNVHLEDDIKGELFLLALRQVARAYGFSDIAQAAELGRESLYKSLSKKGNPKLTTLVSVLKAMGLKLEITKMKKKRIS